jgi:methylenetetrahydrofolate--tRNA-(uracil-5-)-methyltransferase
VESSAIGLLAGIFAAAERRSEPVELPPPTTAFGALLNHITGGHLVHEEEAKRSFQPMNINFGLFPPVTVERVPGKRMSSHDKGMARKKALSARALNDLDVWLSGQRAEAAE